MPLVLVWACTPAEEAPQQQTRRASSLVGRLENQNIDEASGLARSQDDPNRYWVINDGGPAALYAIDNTGKELGRVKLSGASNKDWEDVASFRLQGKPYLLVADIGDNKASREDVRLYVVEEPDPGQSRAKPSRRIDFEYPEGPRDAEAVAVDDENARALILTKNDIPALLYSVSLAPAAKSAQTAMRLGAIGSLPQPSRRDVQFAPKTDNWYWQPTAMDISADGSAAIILTYGGVFLYRKEPGEDWLDALQRQPRIISRTRNPKAESVAFNATSDAIYITIEQRNAPLFRLDLGAAPDQRAPTQGEPEQ